MIAYKSARIYIPIFKRAEKRHVFIIRIFTDSYIPYIRTEDLLCCFYCAIGSRTLIIQQRSFYVIINYVILTAPRVSRVVLLHKKEQTEACSLIHSIDIIPQPQTRLYQDRKRGRRSRRERPPKPCRERCSVGGVQFDRNLLSYQGFIHESVYGVIYTVVLLSNVSVYRSTQRQYSFLYKYKLFEYRDRGAYRMLQRKPRLRLTLVCEHVRKLLKLHLRVFFRLTDLWCSMETPYLTIWTAICCLTVPLPALTIPQTGLFLQAVIPILITPMT